MLVRPQGFLFAAAPLQHDAFSHTTDVGATDPVSLSHSIPGGKSRMLVVGATVSSALQSGTPTTRIDLIEFGSLSLTQLNAFYRDLSLRSFGSALWYLLAPPIVTDNVKVHWTSETSQVFMSVGVWSFSGVDLGDPFVDHDGVAAIFSTVSKTVDALNGGVVIDMLQMDQNPSPGAGQTQQYETSGTISSSTLWGTASNENALADGPVTMSWSPQAAQAHAVASVRPKNPIT